MQWYVRNTITPKTELICLAGFTNSDIAKLCYKFASELATPVKSGTVSSFLPMCEDVCWSSCTGRTPQDRDGFDSCRSSDCADAPCSDFLLSECPEETLPKIRRIVDATCGLGSPSPPPGPSPPPAPPPPPRHPPPLAAEYGELRLRSEDLPSDPDCKPVTYNECMRAAKEVAPHLGSEPAIDLILAACESNVATGPCFIGCTLGGPGPAHYVYLSKEKMIEFGNYNSYRCSAAGKEYCLCAREATPPPPPSAQQDELEWRYSGTDVAYDFSSSASAFYKLAATDLAMPADYRGYTKTYECLAEDDGAAVCARHCADNLKDDLVSFSVTGHIAPPPPPSPEAPPLPPAPPPSPLPPWGEQFNGANDGCSNAGVYVGSECRDGGVGSIFPPYCDFGSQHTYCGPRQYVGQNSVIGDDSCEHANDGVCQDGGPSSVYYTDAQGKQASLCRYATDKTDCPERRLTTLGPLSFSNAGRPAAPLPPPLPPRPPPLLPPAGFTACNQTCVNPVDALVCSDGGEGAMLIDLDGSGTMGFACDYGTQCDVCGTRLQVAQAGSDSYSGSRNGVCEDTVVGGPAGYSTDMTDCKGVRNVQYKAGPFLYYPDARRSRRLQNAGEAFRRKHPPPPPPPPNFSQGSLISTYPPPPNPPPPPSPPPPPPNPSPPIDRDICECSCSGSGSSADEDVSAIALVAQGVPKEDTRLYVAKAAIERGAEMNPVAEVYVNGENDAISAFIPSPAQDVPVSHLLRGWLVNPTTPTTTSQTVTYTSPNASIGFDRNYWMERCVGSCGERSTRYMLHYVQVNILEPDAMSVQCTCYESANPNVPDNADAMHWASHNGARVANQYVDLYAVGPPRWFNSYEPPLGGTLYYKLAYHAGTRLSGVLLTPAGPTASTALQCGHLCVNAVGKESLHGFEHDPDTKACSCTTTDPIAMSTHAYVYQDGSNIETYSAYWCEGARPSSNLGAYVFSYKYGRWCPGRVAGALGNAVIAGGVLDLSSDLATTCKSSCENDGTCNLVEVLGTSWHEVVGANPSYPHPPPLPPLPPHAPPPTYPPLPPNYPILGAGDRLRKWFPVDNDVPVQDEDGQYSLTCGAPTSCGIVSLPVFRGDYLSVVTISRELQRDREFSATLCPWECSPRLVEHELGTQDLADLEAGIGFGGLIPDGLISDVEPDTSQGGVVMKHTYEIFGMSVPSQCRQQLMGRGVSATDGTSVSAIATGMMGLFYKRPGDLTGVCRGYKTVRSPIQKVLWTSWATHANNLTRTGHLQAPVYVAKRVIDEANACDDVNGRTCVWWAEFDDASYNCKPLHDQTNMLANVMTPMKMIETLEILALKYPPPSPPPPAPPDPPSPPPPPPLMCKDDELPTLSSILHPTISKDEWKCW